MAVYENSTIYEDAARLTQPNRVTLVEGVLLCCIAFAAGWILAFCF